MLNYPFIISHRRSTTVSLELSPFIHFTTSSLFDYQRIYAFTTILLMIIKNIAKYFFYSKANRWARNSMFTEIFLDKISFISFILLGELGQEHGWIYSWLGFLHTNLCPSQWIHPPCGYMNLARWARGKFGPREGWKPNL